ASSSRLCHPDARGSQLAARPGFSRPGGGILLAARCSPVLFPLASPLVGAWASLTAIPSKSPGRTTAPTRDRVGSSTARGGSSAALDDARRARRRRASVARWRYSRVAFRRDPSPHHAGTSRRSAFARRSILTPPTQEATLPPCAASSDDASVVMSAMRTPRGSGLKAGGKLPGLTAFFPAHNEEGNVVPMAERLLAVLPRVAEQWELVIVDDGS